MTRHDTLKWLPAALIFAAFLAIAPVAWAGEPLEVSVHAGGDVVTWAPAEAGEFLLRVSLPSGKVVERRGSGSLRIDGRAVPGRVWAEGVYVWELISMSAEPAGERRLPATGSFRVSGASFHLPADRAEAEAEPRARATEDQTVPDDLIVDGKACLGLGCATGEGFLGEALRLKQANIALRFEDTSTVTNIPTRDWQITVNEPGTTGVDKFAIQDLTAGTTPVTVRGGAPSNSLYVDVAGNLGAGTATPAADLHLSGAAAQTVRLEKTGAPARTWDLAADDTSFRVVDVTNSSAVPLQVAAGTPAASLAITANAFVGLGTTAPTSRVHILENVDANTVLAAENTSGGLMAAGVLRARSSSATVNFQAHGPGRTLARFGQTLASWAEFLQVNGNGLIIGTLTGVPLILGTNNANRVHITGSGDVGIGTTSPTGALQVWRNLGAVGSLLQLSNNSGIQVLFDRTDAGANDWQMSNFNQSFQVSIPGSTTPQFNLNSSGNLTIGGTQYLTGSSRDLKENFEPVDPRAILQRVAGLPLTEWNAKGVPGERHIGPVAEEWWEAFALGPDDKHISSTDVAGVALAAIKGLNEELGDLRSLLAEQRRLIEALNQEVAALRSR